MPSTTNYQAGDLILVDFPFAGGGRKTGQDPTGSRIQAAVASQDVPITDWQGAGLLAASIVRLHKLAILEKSLIHRVLGSLQSADRSQVSAVMKQLYGTW